MEELKKHFYDEHKGLHYTLVGDYYIPDLKLSEQPEAPIERADTSKTHGSIIQPCTMN